MTAADFPVPEARLAEALGLPRKQLKGVRADALEQGSDWAYVDGGAVYYSRLGITHALPRLGIAPEKIALLMPAEPSAPTPPAPAVHAQAPIHEAVACEGCGELSTTCDAEGVWLCAPCAACLAGEPEEDSAANEPELLSAGRLDLIDILRQRMGLLGLLAVEGVIAELDLTDPAVVAITVTRCFTVNRRIVAGRLGDESVRVRVKNSQKLRVGMVLHCTHVEADLYELAERLPRWANKR